MDERDQVSSFDCDHQQQGSQPEDVLAKHDIFRSMNEFEEKYFPENHEKYPVTIHHRVTQEEADAINDWIRKRRY